jgi:hypothetical protein
MATATTTVNVTTQKADAVLEMQAFINGINTLLPGVDPFRLSRQTLTRAQLLAQAQARLDAATATKNARLTLHTSVEAERIAAQSFQPIRVAFRAYLVAIYGANAPELQQYGYVQNRKPKRTAQGKATAAAKAKATRAARGTKGKKQKAAIKGTPSPDNGTATTASPVSPVAAGSPAPSPSPAPALAPATSPAPAPTAHAPANGASPNPVTTS